MLAADLPPLAHHCIRCLLVTVFSGKGAAAEASSPPAAGAAEATEASASEEKKHANATEAGEGVR